MSQELSMSPPQVCRAGSCSNVGTLMCSKCGRLFCQQHFNEGKGVCSSCVSIAERDASEAAAVAIDKRGERRGCITGLVGLGTLILGIVLTAQESAAPGGSNGFGVMITLAGIIALVVGIVITTRHPGQPGDWWGWG